jgi:hypothetical protein
MFREKFFATGQPLTLEKMAEIELETLIKSGADSEKARALVDLAYKEIKALPGLDVSKLGVPWSP